MCHGGRRRGRINWHQLARVSGVQWTEIWSAALFRNRHLHAPKRLIDSRLVLDDHQQYSQGISLRLSQLSSSDVTNYYARPNKIPDRKYMSPKTIAFCPMRTRCRLRQWNSTTWAAGWRKRARSCGRLRRECWKRKKNWRERRQKEQRPRCITRKL